MRNILAVILISSLSTSLMADAEMVCTAEHPELEEVFYGEGIKFIGASKALFACSEAAEEAGLSDKECKLSCEVLID